MDEGEVLRVALPREMQRATFEAQSATPSATPAQRPSIKAASLLVLERNKARNSGATEAEKPRNTCATPETHRATPAQQAAVRAWLAAIGETDPELIEEFMERCRRDPSALTYALRQAGRDFTEYRERRQHHEAG